MGAAHGAVGPTLPMGLNLVLQGQSPRLSNSREETGLSCTECNRDSLLRLLVTHRPCGSLAPMLIQLVLSHGTKQNSLNPGLDEAVREWTADYTIGCTGNLFPCVSNKRVSC